GMSPGASLAVLKVTSITSFTFTSTVLQAIEYAAFTDNVDVICEGFSLRPYPDQAKDPIAIANGRATASGIVVVTGSGFAGPANTIDSPGSGPDVINVGSSTTLRIYKQTTRGGFQLSDGDYLDDNVSAQSPSGTGQLTPRTVDVVAPGDL